MRKNKEQTAIFDLLKGSQPLMGALNEHQGGLFPEISLAQIDSSKESTVRLIRDDLGEVKARTRSRTSSSSVKRGVSVSPSKKDIASANDNAEVDIWSTNDVGFMPRAFIQTCLPIREPKNALVAWGRRSGDRVLIIQPGAMPDPNSDPRDPVPKMVSMGYPFGFIPRLLIAYVASEVKRTKQREVGLGATERQTMEMIGLGTGGRDYERFRLQYSRLTTCRMMVTSSDFDAETGVLNDYSRHIHLFDSTNTVWQPASKDSAYGRVSAEIVLSEAMRDEILSNPVPISISTLYKLRTRPMAMDLYCWLTYTMFSIKKTTNVSWERLKLQFGAEVETLFKFRQTFKEALGAVREAGYAPRVDVTTPFLILHPSDTHVPRLPR